MSPQNMHVYSFDIQVSYSVTFVYTLWHLSIRTSYIDIKRTLNCLLYFFICSFALLIEFPCSISHTIHNIYDLELLLSADRR
jgi:hypothetical protein